MDVTLSDAEGRLAQLIQAVSDGERVVITKDGQPVAELGPPRRAKVILGTMRDRIQLLPGWDDPIDEADFLGPS